jgi:hypothetical protein
MPTETEHIASLDWPAIAEQLDQEGYALLPGLLDSGAARALANFAQAAAGREFAPGGLFDSAPLSRDSLPGPLPAWRHAFYRHLAPLANRWNETLGETVRYPAALDEFQRRHRQAGQSRAQARFSCLREGDYEALHQATEGEPIFPLQLVAVLSEAGRDFTGGEFVMTEQRPRMQSRPMVLPLSQGDAALIAVAHRPCRGSRGYYRGNLKHAISRVRSGTRLGLELLFHEAP